MDEVLVGLVVDLSVGDEHEVDDKTTKDFYCFLNYIAQLEPIDIHTLIVLYK